MIITLCFMAIAMGAVTAPGWAATSPPPGALFPIDLPTPWAGAADEARLSG